MNDFSGTLVIENAATVEQGAALRLLFRHLNERDLTAVVGGLLAGAQHDPLPLAGLITARRSSELVGAVWAQTQPGATAVVWPPVLVAGEPDSTAATLLTAALDVLRARRVSMAQALLSSDTEPAAQYLQAGGFRFLAKLFYLMATEASFPQDCPASELTFEPYAEANHARLAAIVQQTYAGSQDCPALDGQRRIDDVLAGYRATGVFDPDRWRIVRHNERDVGCLLLADHPGADQYELVYMGLVPEARGRAWGRQVVRHAQWLTELAGRPRIVLAVDADNRPALEMYRRCGFVLWNERTVYGRFFSAGE